VGGSYSAVEIAGEIAPHVASLTHITPRPFWIIPRYIPLRPSDPDSPFGPVDIPFYKRSTRRVAGEVTFPDAEAIKGKNCFLKTIMGNQSLLSPSLAIPEEDAAFTAFSEHYSNGVRARKIEILRGRLSSTQDNRLILEDGTETEPFDVLIMATGFTPSLPFFTNDVLQTIQYEPSDLLTPLILHRNTFHPSLKNAAFAGMYRGLYMGVLELQSRWIAQIFAGHIPAPSAQVQIDGLSLEHRIRSHIPRTQFPHIDYVGIMADLASEVGIDPTTAWPGRNTDTVTPAQYGTGEVASSLIGEVESDLAAAEKGKWVAGAVYSALQGTWSISRRLESAHSAYPSGTFTGQATFTRTTSPDTPFEYAYLETGELVTDSGLRFDAQRKYRYVYDEEGDRLDAYFDDASSGFGFFHSLRILEPGEDRHEGGQWAPWVGEQRKGWCAMGDHLCKPDFYTAAYWFAFSGVHLDEFRIAYKVKGPSKDYVATATYTR